MAKKYVGLVIAHDPGQTDHHILGIGMEEDEDMCWWQVIKPIVVRSLQVEVLGGGGPEDTEWPTNRLAEIGRAGDFDTLKRAIDVVCESYHFHVYVIPCSEWQNNYLFWTAEKMNELRRQNVELLATRDSTESAG
jgi:hypothetical protein